MLVEATQHQLTIQFFSVDDKGAARLQDTCRLTETRSGRTLKCERSKG